jgi:hypothetical protein
MSPRRPTDLRAAAALWLAFMVSMGAWSAAQARTEVQAADELIAVLGATLPCTRYAVAWLAESPSRIDYHCIVSIEKAMLLREEGQTERVHYAIDMRAARNRYASAYRFRGTPTPAVVLAQFLEGVATRATSKGTLGRHSSPLIVYSKNTVPPPSPTSLVTGLQPSQTRKGTVHLREERNGSE